MNKSPWKQQHKHRYLKVSLICSYFMNNWMYFHIHVSTVPRWISEICIPQQPFSHLSIFYMNMQVQSITHLQKSDHQSTATPSLSLASLT